MQGVLSLGHWGNPQVTSCHRGTIQGWTQSPSPTRQKHWVTFAKGRAPLPTEESPECDAKVDEVLWLPPPVWQTEKAPQGEANWSMGWPRDETETILQGWGRGQAGKYAATGPSPWPTAGWGGAISDLRWLAAPTNIDAKWPGALSNVPHGLDSIVHQTCSDAELVGGASGNPWSWGLSVVCQDSACLLWGAEGTQPGKWGWQWPHTSTLTPFNREILVLTIPGWVIWHSGLLTCPTTEHTVAYVRVLQYW